MFIIIIKNRQVKAIVSTSHNLCVKPHNFVADIYNSYLLVIPSMTYISSLVFLQFRRSFCNTHRNATVLFCSPEGSRPVTHYLLRGQGGRDKASGSGSKFECVELHVSLPAQLGMQSWLEREGVSRTRMVVGLRRKVLQCRCRMSLKHKKVAEFL